MDKGCSPFAPRLGPDIDVAVAVLVEVAVVVVLLVVVSSGR